MDSCPAGAQGKNLGSEKNGPNPASIRFCTWRFIGAQPCCSPMAMSPHREHTGQLSPDIRPANQKTFVSWSYIKPICLFLPSQGPPKDGSFVLSASQSATDAFQQTGKAGWSLEPGCLEDKHEKSRGLTLGWQTVLLCV